MLEKSRVNARKLSTQYQYDVGGLTLIFLTIKKN